MRIQLTSVLPVLAPRNLAFASKSASVSPLALLFASALSACAAEGEEASKSKPEVSSRPAATAVAVVNDEVVFDPTRPPPGWKLCHRNHCHHEDGRVASYAQVMAEIGATKIVGEAAPKAAPPAPPDVAAIPMDADKSATGLVTRVVKPGTGKTKPGPTTVVTVHYTGWTPDGKAFDSSVARGQPAQFPLGRVMPGWTEGIQLMVVGEERRFWVPEALAFNGAQGKPKGTVVFDIELLEIAP